MNKQMLNLITFSILTLIIGGLIGYSTGHFYATKNSFPQIVPIKEVNSYVTTIKLMEAENGTLVGYVEGQKARLAYSSEQILELLPGDRFELPIDDIDLHLFYLENQIPENAHFIASKSGKYYYHILDKRSLGITPKNRVFFSTSKEAEKAGYLVRE